MSYFGRKAVAFDFERRWAEGHRSGKVHSWERSRILRGDYSPIVRDLEPEFTEGAKRVLSQTRPRGALVRDPLTRMEIFYPKSPPQPLFWIIVRDVVRHRAGYWRVRFDVYDRREIDLYVRSKPPVFTQGDDDDIEPVDDEQVRIDSAYTTNPEQALDHLSAVPANYQNVLVMQATSRFADHKREERADQEVRQDLQRLNSELRELTKRAAKMGVNPVEVLAPIVREVESQHATLKDAA